MTAALRALTAEPWAIRPDYLQFMASLASLDRGGRAERRSAEGDDWFRLDLAAAAGPTAQRLEGARYTMLTREGVAIVPVVGPIFPRANLMTEMSGTGTSAAMLGRDLQIARDSADVGAILLMVDSPGGSPIRPDLTRELQAERKATAAQIDTLMKRAGTTRDGAEPGEIEAQVKALVERQRGIARQLIEAETANPDEVDSRPELRERLAAANEELDARLAGYTDRVAEARRRITESLLASQERALGRQKAVVDAQVAQLDKQIRDPATTVDKAAELAAKVRDLLQQGIDIVDRQASLRLAREAVTAPTGFNRTPALGESANAVARQVADAAEGAGRSDRLRTLLRFGSFESDFNPAAVSSTGAKGVFQFTRGTAADMGLSDPTDVAASALAAIRYFDAIDKTLRAKGLNLSDDNRYVLYNQGEGGGAALLASPGKGAAQALTDAGVSAARAREAITANGGREGDTSAEFTTRLLAAFNTKAARADRLVTPTGDALDEGEAAGRKARAEAATTDEANARAIRQKRIALEQRQLDGVGQR